MKVYPLRLLPGMEIKKCLIEFVKSNELSAAFIITCCGSVKSVTLRYATGDNQEHKVHIYDVHKLVVLHSLLIKEGLDKRGVLTWTLRLAIIHWSVRRRGGDSYLQWENGCFSWKYWFQKHVIGFLYHLVYRIFNKNKT